jgi:hypothetical protein
MTAVALGVLFLAGAAWAWRQLEALSLPNRAWSVNATQTQGTASAGNVVTFERMLDGKAEPLGTGVLESISTQGGTSATMVVANVKMNEGVASPRDANHVSVAPSTGGTPLVGTLERQSVSGIPIFQRVYLQLGVALVLHLRQTPTCARSARSSRVLVRAVQCLARLPTNGPRGHLHRRLGRRRLSLGSWPVPRIHGGLGQRIVHRNHLRRARVAQRPERPASA